MNLNFKTILLLPCLCILITACSKQNNSTKAQSNNTSNTIHSKNITKRKEIITSSDEAKNLLQEGNKRFVENKTSEKDISLDTKKHLVSNGQHPYAVVVTCSDSRVPPELIFDQGLGDLFVIRNAGNVIDPISMGSIEYGTNHLGTPLVVVLGHTNCGAVKATVDGGKVHGNISSIIKEIQPSLDKAKTTTSNKDELYTQCENENIINSVTKIKNNPVIQPLINEKKVVILGAKYDMETGKVIFMDNE